MWVEAHSGAYRIRDRVGGRIVTVSKEPYPTKQAAKDAMATLRADQLRGDMLMPGGGRILLAEFIDEWWPLHERSLRPNTVHSEGGRVRNHIRDLLGGYSLDELEQNPMIVAKWVDYLSAGVPDLVRSTPEKQVWQRRPLAPKTVRNCHGALHTILDAAVAAKRIRANPCAVSKKSLPAKVDREMRFLTDPEIGRLITALPAHWRPLVLLLVATGLRWGEAIGLRVKNVDPLAKRPLLRVVEQLQERSTTAELAWSPPKTAKSRRTVSFTRQVALALAGLVAGKGRDEVVFTTPTGLLIRTRNFRRVWLAACERAGLAGLRVHDLRHTHAAMLISAGRPLSAISRRLGHSSIAVTDTLYGHLREEVDEGILAAVDEALAGIDLEDLAAEVDDELVDELRLAA